MIEITLARGGLREIEEVAGALKAALGTVYHSMSLTPRRATIRLTAGADAAAQALAEQTYVRAVNAIDHAQPSPSQQRGARQQAARAALVAADFTGLRARVAAANSVPALRTEVEALMQIILQLALAQGLIDTDTEA